MLGIRHAAVLFLLLFALAVVPIVIAALSDNGIVSRAAARPLVVASDCSHLAIAIGMALKTRKLVWFLYLGLTLAGWVFLSTGSPLMATLLSLRIAGL